MMSKAFPGAVIQRPYQQITTVNNDNVQVISSVSTHTSYHHWQPQCHQQYYHHDTQQPLYYQHHQPMPLHHHHQRQPQVCIQREPVYHTQPPQILEPYQSAVSPLQRQPVTGPISYGNMTKKKSSGQKLMRNLKLANTAINLAGFGADIAGALFL